MRLTLQYVTPTMSRKDRERSVFMEMNTGMVVAINAVGWVGLGSIDAVKDVSVNKKSVK